MVNQSIKTLFITCILFSFILNGDVFAQAVNQLFKAAEISPRGWVAKDRSEVTAHGLEIDRDVLYSIRNHEISDFSVINSRGDEYEVIVQRVIHHDENNWSVTGYMNGSWENSITLSYSNGRVLSNMKNISGHSFYRLLYDERAGSHLMIQLDPHETDELSCGLDHEIATFDMPMEEAQKIPQFDADPDRIDVIDVMIVYTQQAANWAEFNAGGIDNVINEAMAVAQQSADNGQTNLIFRLVHRALVDYQETRTDSATDLRRLTASRSFNPFGNQYGGYLDEVHDWRNEYGADLVAMFTFAEDVGGIAWLMNNMAGSPNFGFSITRVQQALGSTHAHEIGHNMGNNHSRNQQLNAAGSAGGLFEYSTGWRWTASDGRKYVSVMTYNEGDIGYNTFSNPDVLHLNTPTGSYTDTGAPADNARSMREIKHVIANYRDGDPLFFVPTVTINAVRDVTTNSAEIEVEITDDGGETITNRGLCWSENVNPSLSDNCISVSGGKTFTERVTGLNENTTYYVRAYATNRTGTGFSQNRNFFTQGSNTPVVITKEPQNITITEALAGGRVTDSSGSSITETGICYSRIEMPGFADTCISSQEAESDFSVQISQLDHSTRYFVRAYATNQSGSAFGDEKVFTTDVLMPPVTLSATDRTAISFRANWEPVSDANNYRLDVSRDPDFEEYISGFQDRNVGTGTGFTITGLSPGTNYYYRLRSQITSGLSLYSDIIEVTTINISAASSQVEADRDRVLATGIQDSEIRIMAVNSRLEPVQGVTVSLRPSAGNPVITPIQDVTDANGLAIFSVTNTREETITFTAVAAGLDLSRIFTIEFVFADGELTLGNNFPNPFRTNTTIPIVIPEVTRVRIDLFTSNGSHVRSITDQEYNVGYFEIPLNMNGLSSGVYFYRMVTDSDVKTEKLMVIQ